MGAPLSVHTKKEKHTVMRFLWAESVAEAEIIFRRTAQYGNSILVHQNMYEWRTMFKNGHTSVTEEQ
jgi:hypothetical protein